MTSSKISQALTPIGIISRENARFMGRVYRWMTGGLLITAFVAQTVGQYPDWVATLFVNRPLFWLIIGLQLGAVIFLSSALERMRAFTAKVVFLGYAALTGVTMSSIFYVYTFASITNVFLITASAFAGLSVFGTMTKRDLGPVGSFCMMGLFGLVGFWIFSILFPSLQLNDSLQKSSALIGLVVFSGLTAYDTQKIKNLNRLGNEGTEEDTKEAISGALALYLDFINLFLNLLRLMGRRRD